MKTTVALSLWLALGGICRAEQVLAEYDWQKLADGGHLRAGIPVIMEGRAAVKISNTNDTPLQAQLLAITNPPVTKTLYAIVGEVRYEGVQGDGYLEMWNYFPPLKSGMPEGAFFSRTLGVSGEMGKMTGTSSWRRFMLPFDRTGASGPPTRLEINAFLPGRGTVWLGPVKLVEYPGSLMDMQEGGASAWWSDRMAGLIGGTAGAVIGCLGGLMAWLAAKGRSRSFVVGTSLTLIGLGTLSTLAGVIAIALRQPYGVWFPLVLGGVLLLGILPLRLRDFQKRYAEMELRKMSAMDA